MAESQRIEDLRKRYHENPRRFFAPLANEYRKAGHLDRALLLCEKHLKEQPDNMNGLVVYGQTLFESDHPEEAKEPLTAALGVDPENLIALRLLGDISRLADDLPTARMWYEKVLEVDRRNDEVLDLLQQMGGGEAGDDDGSATGATNGPVVTVAGGVSLSGGDAHDALGMIDLDAPAPVEPPKPKKAGGAGSTVVIDAASLARADAAESRSQASPATPAVPVPPPAPVAAHPSKRASLLDVAFDFSEMPADDGSARAEPLVPQQRAEEPPAMADSLGTDALMVETTGDVAPLAGLEPTEFAPEEAEAAPTLEGLQPSELDAPEIAPLAGLESAAEDVVAPAASAPEIEVASSAEAVAEELPTLEVSAFVPPADELPAEVPPAEAPPAEAPPAKSESEPDLPMMEIEQAPRPKPRMTKSAMSSIPLLADYGLEDDVPPVEEPRKAAKTPAFVTETMATLYLKQGYTDQAIEVYRQLIAQDPSDAGLKERLAALERGDDTGLDFETPAADAPEPTPAPANAVLDDVSFAGVGLSTPAPAPAPLALPAPSGPSAREFFGAFARRAATPGGGAAVPEATDEAPILVESAADSAPTPAPSPAPATATGWPLDALFGAASDVADLHAAEVIASVGTFEGPTGGTGLDQLFSGDAAPRAKVNRASKTLKFDQFFSPTGAAPAAGASEPGVPEAPAAPAAGEGDAPPAAAGDDDLDQFQGWLKGLKPQ